MKGSNNSYLLQKRNKAIVEKYVYLYDHKRIRFEDVMYKLKWEHFFLGERVLKSVLKKAGIKFPYTHRFNAPHKDGLEMLEVRNNKVIKRFDTLSRTTNMRIDDIISQLSKSEFYVQEITIERIVSRWSHRDKAETQEKLFD